MPYLAYDRLTFDVICGSYGDCFDRYAIRLNEIRESMRIVHQILDGMPGGDYRIQDKKVTPPPRARIDESMEALIHHFKIFTEGFKVPAGEVYAAVESPRGELGCYMVSDGGSKPLRVHVRAPSFVEPAGVAVHDGRRPDRRRRGHHLLRRPDHGRGGPLMAQWPQRRQREAGRRDHRALPPAPLGADPAAAPGAGPGLLCHRRGHGARRRTGGHDTGGGAQHLLVL